MVVVVGGGEGGWGGGGGRCAGLLRDDVQSNLY